MFDLDDFLTKAHKAKASDVHLSCGKNPSLRINGEIYKITAPAIEASDIKNILEQTVPKEYGVDISTLQDLDYIYEVKGVSRFRVNFCRDIFYGKLTFRVIPYHIKTLDELKLPEFLKTYTQFNNGIVFVTGATGSGKSTTLSSLIEIINETQKKHIITIEDPVEFVHDDKKSIVTQRSLDIDVKDFKTGIKYALRQDPDIMLVGEIRDLDTLLSAIEASETGHLVFSTLHTNGTVAALDRLKGFLPESGQELFLKRLANCIRGIVHQQLVPSTNKGALVPALEILTFTSTIIDYVKNNKLKEIYPIMQKTTQQNLTTMNSSLYALYQKGIITKETAIEYSFEKIEIEQMIKGIYRNAIAEETLL